jgi:hypothetical protein
MSEVTMAITRAARLWAADPHEFGPGKIHIVDDEDDKRTYCGRYLEAIPGNPVEVGRATCKHCLNHVVGRRERRAHQEIADRENRARLELDDRENQARLRAKEAENAKWWADYNCYLKSPAWRERSQAVLRRAGGTCEGCLKRRAVQVHHLSYAHVCDEFLWELRAVCLECHERWHAAPPTQKSRP